jgi:Ca2+-binding EF-hand superfamily protein
MEGAIMNRRTLDRRTLDRRTLLIAAMSLTGVSVAQKVAPSAQQDKFAMANQDVKELLLMMDTDKNGKISKREWMSFMEAEFNRLDKDGNGELDLMELRQSGVLIRRSQP